jgi:hypothetical protein
MELVSLVFINRKLQSTVFWFLNTEYDLRPTRIAEKSLPLLRRNENIHLTVLGLDSARNFVFGKFDYRLSPQNRRANGREF